MDQALANLANRLRWSVSSAVSQAANNLNHVLPGNPVTREYDLIQLIGSGGPGLIWKIYAGIKKSTKQEASIFVLEKRAIDAKIANKKDRDAVIEMLKKGVTQLTKLRHPSILIVQHPMEESRDSLAFACEPVLGSLANLLSGTGPAATDGDSPTSEKANSLAERSEGYNFFQVEIKYGLLQVAEALKFLHNDAKMLHRNLCPESIFVNKNGAWKLGAFDFAVPASNPNSGQPLEYPMLSFPATDSSSPLMMPNPDFIAPEYVDSNRTEVETAADLYSLGALTYCVFNKGKVLLPTGGQPHSMSRVAKLRAIPITDLACIPDEEGSRQQVKLLLSIETSLRPDAHQFTQLNMFSKDVQVKTLQYLDALYQWDNLQKSQFYKGLHEILKQMPKRVKIQRVTTALVKEFLQPEMVPFVLPNILLIAEEATEQEFVIDIFPHLVPVFKMMDPIQIPYILLQKMSLILEKSKPNPDGIKTHILPMLFKCLEPEVQPQIQELCLTTVPIASPHIDYNLMKNHLLPRLKKLCLATGLLSVRVKCLVTIGKLLNVEEGSASSSMDKWLVIDEVLPLLAQVPTKEPAVIMAILGIVKIATTNPRVGLSKEVLATRVLPFLMPMAIENGLSLPQFRTVMSLIRDLLDQVENEHQSKLEQLQSMKAAQQPLQDFALNPITGAPCNSESDNDFAKFFGGGGSATSPSKAANGFDPFNLSKSDFNSSQVNKDLSSPFGSTRPSSGLSLEDKERIAREREQAAKFGASEQPLQPSNMSNASKANQPKDLTSSLICSNLASLSLSSSSSLSPASSMSQLSNRSVFNSSPLSQPVIGSTSSAFGPFNSMPSFQPQPQVGSFGGTGAAPTMSGNLYPQLSSQPVKPQVNLSAFDSLTLPGISSGNKNKQPMASLASSTVQPTAPPLSSWSAGGTMASNNISSASFLMGQNSQSSSSNNVNPLSKSDLDEFLS